MVKSSIIGYTPDFFNTLIKESLSKTGVLVSVNVIKYLCELLQFYIVSDHLFSQNSASKKKQIQTLAELYLQSNGSKTALKKIGDMSLYMSGFFTPFLNKKTVSVKYYISMGKHAYFRLSYLQNKELFTELANCFSELVFVLSHIKQSSSKHTYKDFLILLDEQQTSPAKTKGFIQTQTVIKKRSNKIH